MLALLSSSMTREDLLVDHLLTSARKVTSNDRPQASPATSEIANKK
jgi:hypothetical protein